MNPHPLDVLLAFLIAVLFDAALLAWMFGGRRLYFGWICKLRGYHKARRPRLVVNMGYGYVNPLFVCVCGAEKLTTVDVGHGGRIPVPVRWEVRK